ncbi:hypothetical protein AMATHDRAFT_3880 [Amanita thiersii Skay4041]|uniref:Uncharacterized protein n=1 Tax=Amanita thiersii Skay4041 TaxID=703135 RepID=A0A2A9NQA1_9AGAR|nr:hypothetical protein AMATHDRAFT_3880 [Amanita thiersii Skay4041]
MALITDTDFLVHNLRLSYLREVEDPYGPRLISLDQSYHSNPYVVTASLADSDRWPELSMPSSPPLSEDEVERPTGFPGARLKHTHTIMGDKAGGFGIRINGKRMSVSKRTLGSIKRVNGRKLLSVKQDTLSKKVPTLDVVVAPPEEEAEAGWKKESSESSACSSTSQPNVKVQAPTAVEDTPVTKAVQFAPSFAKMEAQRRARIAARRNAAMAANPPPQVKPVPMVEYSSDDDEADSMDESSSDEEFGIIEHVGSLDEVDEFDPEFAVTRPTITYDSASDVVSDFSTSMSNASLPISSSQINSRSRPRLSPVEEGSGQKSHHRQTSQRSIEGNFVMLTPAPVEYQQGEKYYPPRRLDTGVPAVPPSRPKHTSISPVQAPQSGQSSELTFTRKKVGPVKPVKSSLSAMMASSGSTNPFAELYAAVSGRGEMASTNVQVFFPHAERPSGTPMTLNVKKDATVEEVIGFALWTYWEEKWLPKLDEDLSGENDPKWEDTMSAVKWVLRIAEMDGEVDDDFPPPDRIGKIARFNSEAYAIIEATPNQVEQNKVIHEKIHKKPEKLTLPGPNTVPVAGSSATGSALGSIPAPSYLGPSSSHGPQILLRIRIAEHADAVHVSTTIPVSSGMYLQEALELLCRKRRNMDPKDYALLLGDQSLLIPLDRTVASLQGKRELLLVKRSMLPQYGENIVRVGKTTNPDDSIFKKPISGTPEVPFPSDPTTAYKKYTIYRKLPMLVAKQERSLAIDGAYIHIMPSTKKAVFDSAKTASYHIDSIAYSKQSTKMASVFKLVLNGRGSGNKRYDFEAESPKHAAEIVQTINALKNALERSGSTNRARRSRQIG